MAHASLIGRGNHSAIYPNTLIAIPPTSVPASQQYIDLLEELGMDYATLEHSKRVMELAYDLGKFLNYTKNSNLSIAGLLHDIGKIRLPEGILKSPDHLTPHETVLVHSHPSQGADILQMLQSKGIYIPPESFSTAYDHHENHDGSGYPSGKTNGSIPFCAAIVHVADVYDALRDPARPYRHTSTPHLALEEMALHRQHFHPKVLPALMSLIGGTEYAAQMMRTH